MSGQAKEALKLVDENARFAVWWLSKLASRRPERQAQLLPIGLSALTGPPSPSILGFAASAAELLSSSPRASYQTSLSVPPLLLLNLR
ncbi:hypothetical protein VTN00DRAFT_6133 [Thermoascus crustaceus]|uniref:uncharacterized protein n=1 Tax=Thermoascus crustaceus TaxID=5088 RepID=UPI00374269B1